MNEQNVQTMQPEQHNHTTLYIAIGLSLVTVTMLIVVLSGMLKGKDSSLSNNLPQTTQQIPPEQVSQQTPQQQLQQSVTPAPVATKQDLTTQLNVLDNTDMTAISSGLDQNTADASQF